MKIIFNLLLAPIKLILFITFIPIAIIMAFATYLEQAEKIMDFIFELEI